MASRRGIWLASAAAAVAAAIVLATGGPGVGGRSAATPVSSGRLLSPPTAERLPGGCPVTRPHWRPRRGLQRGRLWIGIGPTGGVYRVPADNVAPDGSLGVKIGWQRGPGLRGRVTIDARRLDERAPAVHRRISPSGYGLTGFQASGLDFPTQGCWRVTATAGRAGLTFVLLVLKAGASRPPVPSTQPAGVIVDCARRSEADFPGAFTDRRNLVAGPLVLAGAGERTPASVVREFGGNKFPALVRAGHRVTVSLKREVRGFAGLAYGGLGRRPLPEGEVRLRDTAHTMTFVACEHGPSPTFWSGFLVTRRPACVPVEIYVDDDSTPRHERIDMGGRRPCRG